MITEPLYLTDPYLKTLDNAQILQVKDLGNEVGLVLDKTIFYPMGGGQATDQGVIYLSNNEKLEVYQVLLKDGEIVHYIKGIKPVEGQNVNLEINWERRYKNMKLHSAGHIIDFAIFLLGYSPTKLVPQRADHNKDPHILYAGILDKDIKEEVQQKVNQLIIESKNFNWAFVDFEDLKTKAIYLQPNLPVNKPLRMLELEGVGAVADGGTIIKNTSEIKGIEITNIESSEGNTIVRYKILD